MGLKLWRAKFQPSIRRGTFSHWRLIEGGGVGKNVRFPTEDWLYVGNGERYGLGYC